MSRIYVGGTAIPVKVREKVSQLLPSGHIYVAYGLSEIAGTATVNRCQGGASTSVGKLINGVKIRVINDNGELCGPNEEGELLIFVELPFLGYVNNAAATNALLDPSGWIRSGDIGRFDDDNSLYIVDRKKDFITYQGRVSPTEVENVVSEAKGVGTVCVVGLPVLDMEELPAALIIPSKREEAASEAEINALLKGILNTI